MRTIAAACAVALAQAASAQPVPATGAGYERLAPLVGTWTVKGEEGRFRETCAWYDGRFHVVCHSENIRADGTLGRGMSILGYVPAEDAYTYHGIGARGRNVMLRGKFAAGVLVFTTVGAASSPPSRVRLGPLTDPQEFQLVEEVQGPDLAWTPRGEQRFVRIDRK